MKVKRKMVMVEVKTELNNNDLKNAVWKVISAYTTMRVVQIQVNLIKPAK